MLRRIHMPDLAAGELALPPSEGHHLRDVLRLGAGSEVELFNDRGETARGVIIRADQTVVVRIDEVKAPPQRAIWSVASAVPKGERAEWMVEKLSELGADAFIPIATARSVVHPEGKNKFERWQRISAESAKQSRRPGVMRIDPLSELKGAMKSVAQGWFLSTAEDATPIHSRLVDAKSGVRLFIGPEGGWTEDEVSQFESTGFFAVKLTSTILRIETAAIAAAAIVATYLSKQSSD